MSQGALYDSPNVIFETKEKKPIISLASREKFKLLPSRALLFFIVRDGQVLKDVKHHFQVCDRQYLVALLWGRTSMLYSLTF